MQIAGRLLIIMQLQLRVGSATEGQSVTQGKLLIYMSLLIYWRMHSRYILISEEHRKALSVLH